MDLREDGSWGGGITGFVRCYLEIAKIPQCTNSNERVESLVLWTAINNCISTVGTMYKPQRFQQSNFI